MNRPAPKIDLHIGDAFILWPKIKDASIDLIILDPPYSGDHHQDINNCQHWFDQAKRCLKNSGTLYIFTTQKIAPYLFILLEKTYNMLFNNWITWHYTQGPGKTKGFSVRHQDILMFTKSNTYNFNIDAIRVPQKSERSTNNPNGANPGDVWQFHKPKNNHKTLLHHHEKPERIIERIILTSSNPGDNILDPFAGSGTTLKVAQALGRNCTGFEIEPKMQDIIATRLSECDLNLEYNNKHMTIRENHQTNPNGELFPIEL